jgi:multidrug resistance efflux pump
MHRHIRTFCSFLTRPSRDTQLILKEIKAMDAKVQALKDAFESYAADYEKTITDAKAQIQAAVDKAIAESNAGRDADLDALKTEIEAAHAKIVPPAPPVFEASNQ